MLLLLRLLLLRMLLQHRRLIRKMKNFFGLIRDSGHDHDHDHDH